MILDKLHNLFVPQFPHLSSRDNNTASFLGIYISETQILWKLEAFFFSKFEPHSDGIKIWPELTCGYLLYSLFIQIAMISPVFHYRNTNAFDYRVQSQTLLGVIYIILLKSDKFWFGKPNEHKSFE